MIIATMDTEVIFITCGECQKREQRTYLSNKEDDNDTIIISIIIIIWERIWKLELPNIAENYKL